MKGMKMPKGGGKGGRMPQMNMDPAQMVRQGFVRECSVVRRHLLGLQLAETHATVQHGCYKGHVRRVYTAPFLCRATDSGVLAVQARMLPPHMLQQVRAVANPLPKAWLCCSARISAIHLTALPFCLFFLLQAVTPRSADCRWAAWVRSSK